MGNTSSIRPGGVPRLSVVVPVFNQASSIVANIEIIRERVSARLGDDFEVIVVSDGSIDTTEDELVAQRGAGGYRVFHYDRNLGKGYAVKLGALESRGRWIGFVDADLDLDPADLADYVARAEADNLDFAIGSKRHPESRVRYPQSRVIASWCFQQLVRLLFRLDVRDTQVGLKVFRREIAEQVLPLLLVKRYAFDIEMLAVSRAFGFSRIGEMPVTLDYKFSGSGVRSRAVLRALIDTAAIFYRLRILRYYQRRRRLSGTYGFTRPRASPESVVVLVPVGGRFRERDYPWVEVVEVDDVSTSGIKAAASAAAGDVIAVLEPGVLPAGNWLSATVPFLVRPDIGAVVTPKLAPTTGPLRALAAGAVSESRIGGGLGYFRYMPGNVRYVRDFPASAFVVRRSTLLEVPDHVPLAELVTAVAATGDRVLYTPEAVVVAAPPPLFRPHLHAVVERAALTGHRLRVRPRGATMALLVGVAVLALAAALGLVLAFDFPAFADVVIAAAATYVVVVAVAAAGATLRYQSIAVGALAFAGIVATHGAYMFGLAKGVVSASASFS